jgi:hypothetical protein
LILHWNGTNASLIFDTLGLHWTGTKWVKT